MIRFLETHTHVKALVADIAAFVRNRVPEYQSSNRGYLTVAVGCTGGQHRSVYIVDRLAEQFAREFDDVTARHSGLPGAKLFQPEAPQARSSAPAWHARPAARNGRPRERGLWLGGAEGSLAQ